MWWIRKRIKKWKWAVKGLEVILLIIVDVGRLDILLQQSYNQQVEGQQVGNKYFFFVFFFQLLVWRRFVGGIVGGSAQVLAQWGDVVVVFRFFQSYVRQMFWEQLNRESYVIFRGKMVVVKYFRNFFLFFGVLGKKLE